MKKLSFKEISNTAIFWVVDFFFFFFSVSGFFHEHSRITGLQGKGKLMFSLLKIPEKYINRQVI